MDRETIKTRALEYWELGDYKGALASMMSDLMKPMKSREIPTANILVCRLCSQLMLAGMLEKPEEIKRFIEGLTNEM